VSSEAAVPIDPGKVEPDGGAIDRLKALCAHISPVLATSQILLNGAATGEAMAELILDGAARTVDLSAFDPARLEALDPERVVVTRRLDR
jgi:hypothetical protein